MHGLLNWPRVNVGPVIRGQFKVQNNSYDERRLQGYLAYKKLLPPETPS